MMLPRKEPTVMTMKFFMLLITFVLATKQNTESVAEMSEQNSVYKAAENPILVKIEEDEYAKQTTLKYAGVYYDRGKSLWRAYRRSKDEKKKIYNGYYKDEETAAHASDTLARKLMANGEQNLKLNFPDDDTEVNPENRTTTSKHIGVYYNKKYSTWIAQRWSRKKNNHIYNGSNYKDEETAAHASDTLARKLMANGEQSLKLNFPDDKTEVHPEKTKSSIYIGVTYNEDRSRWCSQRWSKDSKKKIYNGYYKDEGSAAHASDSLARKLMADGEQSFKLNFPDDEIEVNAEKPGNNKRKRPEESQTYANCFEKFE